MRPIARSVRPALELQSVTPPRHSPTTVPSTPGLGQNAWRKTYPLQPDDIGTENDVAPAVERNSVPPGPQAMMTRPREQLARSEVLG